MKISVVIPMYNAEKYIGDCLDSLLAQTLQDFEVIVVDDCSTDSSCAVVQSYAGKFGGRLKLAHTEKNSGSPGAPGNIGVNLSRGEYLSVLDNDDALTPTALEELYTLAKIFDADVIACEKYFPVPDKFWNEFKLGKIFQPTSYPTINPVNEPTPIPFDVAERVRACYEQKFLWTLWSKLIRRDFLLANEISFAENLMQDTLATCCLAYSAERFIRVPNVVNCYRVRADSLYHGVGEPKKIFRKYIHALTSGFVHLEKFLSGREFFKRRPDMKTLALEIYVGEVCVYLDKIYRGLPVHEFDEILRQEFEKNPSASLAAFVFSAMNFYRLRLLDNLRRSAE